MKSEMEQIGGLVEPVPGVTLEELSRLLPQRLRSHANADAFLHAVVGRVCLVSEMAPDERSATPAQMKGQLEDVATNSHRLTNALRKLDGGSLEVLTSHFEYLHIRAHEVGLPTEGRSIVPALPADVPELPVLLHRLAIDLKTLRAACEYTTNLIRPDRNAQDGSSRRLVEFVTEAYVDAFGKAPPKRGTWFADDFLPYLARCLGLEVGHRVVAAGISQATKKN